MEPVQKKAKITDHFRVALKPQDVNLHPLLKKNKKLYEVGKENIEVITISDDEDEDTKKQQTHQKQITTQQSSPKTKTKEALKLIIEQYENNNRKEKVEERQHQQNFTQHKTNLGYLYDETPISSGPINKYTGPPGLPAHVIDADRPLLNDIRYEPHYAWDSFQYDKQRELKFKNKSYLDDRLLNHQITPQIRARFVSELVEIQDNFKLNHEAIYMSVKLADQYLMRKSVPKKNIHLLFMTTMLISAKFEDRLPPFDITDLIEHSRRSSRRYHKEEVVSFEVEILSTLDFDIGYPLSYGFLRRFARCTQSDLTTLTLARYILESSLLDYEMIEELESKMAAAALLLAFEMRGRVGAWDATAEFYTGYEQQELYTIRTRLNEVISRRDDITNKIIRFKYRHEVYKAVARIHPLAIS